ncbi:lysylphosphatidylglycerol synthase domain-containing protein [Nocardioides okcheonensis]|uniref:lysylphosphatidylglycerol synthase domain-containing protein n=1 Tax=Nocardioides okcheonensis TaxID=2894081 RepID=UPI001E2E9A4C|nr:lysylphosphatidylglycerol synthase domain-containing protein [Nocardioides okcheonensis]UFN45878.1 lysylphosphatidylglycerol synthase domain-containing protein [Nocardioides okcheonensis]
MTRRRALGAARLVFVLLTLAFAWWGFRGRWGEIGAAASTTGPLRLAGAVACATAGLVLTGLLWRLLLRWLGSDVGVRDAASVFFVGQLGKYVPGSVWSIAVQARLGRRHGVPARSSATASLVFLLVHTATGLLAGGLLVLLGAIDLGAPGLDYPGPRWHRAPPLLTGRRPAGRTRRDAVLGGPELVRALGLMAAVWALHGASLLLLVPGGGGSPGLAGAVAAFALAHAVGVLVVLAPAGVGAREAVLVALLSPVVGVPGAAAVALLSRVAQALADFLVAAGAIGCARIGRVRPAAGAGARA